MIRFSCPTCGKNPIYRELMDAAEDAEFEANQRYRITGPGVKRSDALIRANARLEEELTTAKEKEIARRFGIDRLSPEDLSDSEAESVKFGLGVGESLWEAVLSAIAIEGSQKKWLH